MYTALGCDGNHGTQHTVEKVTKESALSRSCALAPLGFLGAHQLQPYNVVQNQYRRRGSCDDVPKDPWKSDK